MLGSAAEFACSWFQEMVFGSVSWQYDGTVLNLQGRINLLHGLLWGLLGLLWVKELYPRLSRLIEKIPNKIGVALTWTLAVLMAADIAISAMAVYRQSERREGIPGQERGGRFPGPNTIPTSFWPRFTPIWCRWKSISLYSSK